MVSSVYFKITDVYKKMIFFKMAVQYLVPKVLIVSYRDPLTILDREFGMTYHAS